MKIQEKKSREEDNYQKIKLTENFSWDAATWDR